jgi:DNA-binding NtrC family response regulator
MSTDRTQSQEKIVAQVLIVEDEIEHAEVMAEALRRPGHICTIVNGIEAAAQELEHGSFDVIVTDLRMPESAGVHGVNPDGGNAGMRVLEMSSRFQPDAETVMVTAHGDVPTARDAFKHGAFDFVEKPLDLIVFRSVVNRAAEQAVLRGEAVELKELVQHDGFEGIVAGSEAMRKILKTVKTVANSKLPVLITGESGTGKELIAQAVHNNSPRSKKRFVTMNCAGQAESLLEDQLFGHVRGAFTGAEKDREGVFEYSDQGTVFLDEIGDMPLPMQAKLLRVLESGEVVRLGSNESKHVDVRFVSATNQDFNAMTADGTFRQDLYFRINGAHIHLPPLRERREDIPRIVRHAIAKFGSELLSGQPIPEISDAAMLRLTAFRWPGNVRQLINVIENMIVMAIGDADEGQVVKVDVQHIPVEVTAVEGDGLVGDAVNVAGSLAGTSLEQLEKQAIRETLKITGGNREQTAKLLGIGERTLYRKLKDYGLR